MSFVLSDDAIARITKRLGTEGAMAIWTYGAACSTQDGYDAARMVNVTGIPVEAVPGSQASRGAGLLEDRQWGLAHPVSRRPTILDTEGVSSAIKRIDSQETRPLIIFF